MFTYHISPHLFHREVEGPQSAVLVQGLENEHKPSALCIQVFSACGRRYSRANEILELARASHPSHQRLVHLCSRLANTQDPLKPLPTLAHILPS